MKYKDDQKAKAYSIYLVSAKACGISSNEANSIFDSFYDYLDDATVDSFYKNRVSYMPHNFSKYFLSPEDIPIYGTLLLISYKISNELIKRIGAPIAKHYLKPVVQKCLERFRGKLDDEVIEEIEKNILKLLEP